MSHPNPPLTADPRAPQQSTSQWANKFRGANIEDLDPPPALSVHPQTPIHQALLTAFERDYTHLTVLHPETKSLLGYISVPSIKTQLASKAVSEVDPVEKAMVSFKRKGRTYKLITMETPLEELQAFFEGAGTGRKEEFAVVTDPARRFVLGVATRGDLEEFVKRRPADGETVDDLKEARIRVRHLGQLQGQAKPGGFRRHILEPLRVLNDKGRPDPPIHSFNRVAKILASQGSVAANAIVTIVSAAPRRSGWHGYHELDGRVDDMVDLLTNRSSPQTPEQS
nr:hypothetical protein B0A51_01185 [Rachicladosporium sp. CCFEE 5018]